MIVAAAVPVVAAANFLPVGGAKGAKHTRQFCGKSSHRTHTLTHLDRLIVPSVMILSAARSLEVASLLLSSLSLSS